MIGICTWPGQVQKREKTDRTKTVYMNSNHISHSKHASSTILRLQALPLPPLPPQTIGVHHLVVSPCCTAQAIAFLVSGGCIPPRTFPETPGLWRLLSHCVFLFFLFKRKTPLPKLTCAEPGTSIHCRAVKGMVNFLQHLHQGVL